MRYEILGPLRVVHQGSDSSIGSQQLETVLAVLLIRAGQVVSREQLINEIWSDRAPRRANAGIHVLISQLRKFLKQCGSADDPIATRNSGYRINIGSDEFDLRAFNHLLDVGRGYARQEMHEEASDCFGSALSLWRGAVLDRVREGPIVEAFAAWAEEARLECVETLTDSRLALGRYRELVGELYALTAEYPLRETFYRQLMLALFGAQRKADALHVYRIAQARLKDELGLEPCRMLQELQCSILRDDLELCSAR